MLCSGRIGSVLEDDAGVETEMVSHCITLGRPGIGSRSSRKDVWSALQTHLQGLDGATLAVVPEKCHHVQPPFLEFELAAASI